MNSLYTEGNYPFRNILATDLVESLTKKTVNSLFFSSLSITDDMTFPKH